MAIILGLNTAFLAVVGAVMLAAPKKLFPTGDELTLAVTQALGAGDLAMASLTGVLLATRAGSSPAALAALSVFHLVLTALQVINRRTAFHKLPVLLTHGAFGAAFAAVLVTGLASAV